MKKILQTGIFMMLTLLSANAQTAEVFSDNFDSYTAGSYLGSVTIPNYTGTYSGWKASGSVSIIASASTAHSGTLSAKLTPSTANNFCSLRKTITVTAGHNYTFSAWTNSDGGGTSAKLNYQFNTTTAVKGSTTASYTANTWNLQSISFTAATSENVDIFVSAYLYGAVVNVYSDDWFVIDNTLATGTTNIKNSDFKFIQSERGQCELKGIEVGLGKVYSAQGKLVKSFNTNTFNLSNLPKGVYLLSVTDKNEKSFTEKFIY